MGVTDHHAQSACQGAVPLAIVTVSDTRTADPDVSGQTIRDLVTAACHVVVDYRTVKDDPGRMGCADRIIRPRMKFATISCRPKPIPRLRAATAHWICDQLPPSELITATTSIPVAAYWNTRVAA